MRASSTVLSVLCVLLLPARLLCWTPENWFETPKSGREVHYDISGVLDWPNKRFEGRMELTWRNHGPSPTQSLPFQLHLNAFRDPAAPLGSPGKERSKKKGGGLWGHIGIKSAHSEGKALEGSIGEDATVYWVRLPKPVEAGGTVRVEIAWECHFPKMRPEKGIVWGGWTGSYLLANGWYPKLGYYDGDSWHCGALAQDAANGNAWVLGSPTPPDVPRGHFGNYDVVLSLPNALMLANTGTVVEPLGEDGEGLKDRRGRAVEAAPDPERRLNFVYKIHAEDVQDFSWAVTPQGGWGLERIDYRETQVFFYHIRKNGSQLERLKKTVLSALRFAEQSIGPYPYPALSIIDLPQAAAGAGSSPTLAVVSNIPFDPFRQRLIPERAATWQVGEQYLKWASGAAMPRYNGLPGALNAWFTARALQREGPKLVDSRRFHMETDFPCPPCPPGRKNGPLHLWAHFPKREEVGGGATSLIQPRAVDQLEAALGEGGMREAVKAYFAEISFKQADPLLLKKASEMARGQSLGKLWEDHFEKRGRLDYRIGGVTGTPQGGGAITVSRNGDIVAPITLWLRLDNGLEVRRTWGGQGERMTFAFDSPISSAILDPDREHPALASRLHATYTEKPVRRGLLYWAQNVFGVLGGILQGVGLG